MHFLIALIAQKNKETKLHNSSNNLWNSMEDDSTAENTQVSIDKLL